MPGGVSVRHLKYVTFQYENRGDKCIVNIYPQQLYSMTSLRPLGYHLATSVLRDMGKGTLCVM